MGGSTAISAMAMALFLSLPSGIALASMPLTETIHMIPENEVELNLQEQFIQLDDYYRRDRLAAGIGVLPSISLWFEFNLLTSGIVPPGGSEVGDLFVKLKFFIGDYLASRLHAAFLARFRIPTGRNAYASGSWRNLALGKNELSLGGCFRLDFLDPLYVHLNTLYTFREGDAEDFYGGFYLNIFEKETWSKVFGLNWTQDGTFLQSKRLLNDYLSFSLAINSDGLYPVIPFIECYTSIRLSRSSGSLDSISIEALGINPTLLLSAGARYFFTEGIYAGLYVVVNPLWQKGFIRMIYGIELSFQF
ncbi:MAG: hypothetical protein JXA20_07500 [Spirochaetes bacterium]|nr:hypothetical protein [Spirochaetota bacterium]